MSNRIGALLDLPFKHKIKRLPNVKVSASASLCYRKLKRFSTNSHFSIGADSVCTTKIVLDREEAQIAIGKRTFIGASLFVSAVGISIGDDVLISWGVTVVDHDSHNIQFSIRRNDVANFRNGKKDWTNVTQQKVTICDKVWIGFGAIILKGVEVGEGSVVAAGSVVTKNVRPWTVVGGNPAQEIKKIERYD